MADYHFTLIVKSFVEIVKFVFAIPDVKVFLSSRLCQDPLEKHFGQQRQRGRVNENPNAKDFVKNTQALRVVNGMCGDVRGNCRGSGTIQENCRGSVQLPKRKYIHKN